MSENGQEMRETSADIADEIRRAVESMGDELPYTVSAGTMRRVADRIEAAWRREKAEIEADALAVGGIVEAAREREAVTNCNHIGNAAAIRAALRALRDASRDFYNQILNSKYSEILDKYTCVKQGFPAVLDLRSAFPMANYALAAPPRQCDVGTADEQMKRQYDTMCNTTKACPDSDWSCRQCFAQWAQMPYEAERKGEGDVHL